jgi:hypothetical protein
MFFYKYCQMGLEGSKLVLYYNVLYFYIFFIAGAAIVSIFVLSMVTIKFETNYLTYAIFHVSWFLSIILPFLVTRTEELFEVYHWIPKSKVKLLHTIVDDVLFYGFFDRITDKIFDFVFELNQNPFFNLGLLLLFYVISLILYKLSKIPPEIEGHYSGGSVYIFKNISKLYGWVVIVVIILSLFLIILQNLYVY